MSYPLGAHLVSPRCCYTHHGIYIGDDTVVHYLDDKGITMDSLAEFSRGKGIQVRLHPDAPYSGLDCAWRALSRVGEDKYNLVFNNCEHFANWCTTGKARSEQVELVDAGVDAFLRLVVDGAMAARIAGPSAGIATGVALTARVLLTAKRTLISSKIARENGRLTASGQLAA